MKTRKFILFWIICCMVSISCSAQKTLSEVSSIKGVTSIYIGKMMLKLAGPTVDFGSDQNAVDLGKLTKDLNSIEIVQCDGNSVDEAQKVCNKVLARYQFELITEVIKDNQKVEISGVLNKDGKTLNMLLISVFESNELVYILLNGKIDLDTLNNAIITD